MKARINNSACTGCGLCCDMVPGFFEMGDDFAEIADSQVPANLEEGVKDAADICQTGAIIVE